MRLEGENHATGFLEASWINYQAPRFAAQPQSCPLSLCRSRGSLRSPDVQSPPQWRNVSMKNLFLSSKEKIKVNRIQKGLYPPSWKKSCPGSGLKWTTGTFLSEGCSSILLTVHRWALPLPETENKSREKRKSRENCNPNAKNILSFTREQVVLISGCTHHSVVP